MPNIRLILENIIKKIENLDYVFIKIRDDFPELKYGEDIDIFTTQRKSIFDSILFVLKKEILDSSLSIQIKNKISKDVIIFKKNDKILLKFEIYFSLSELKNLSVKDCLISNAVYQFNTKYINEKILYKIPNDIYECLIRYIDFSENFLYNPDKKRHLDYLEKLIKDKKVDELEFSKKLYYFVSFLKNNSFEKKNYILEKINILVNTLKTIISYYKNNGLISLIKKIKSRF